MRKKFFRMPRKYRRRAMRKVWLKHKRQNERMLHTMEGLMFASPRVGILSSERGFSPRNGRRRFSINIDRMFRQESAFYHALERSTVEVGRMTAARDMRVPLQFGPAVTAQELERFNARHLPAYYMESPGREEIRAAFNEDLAGQLLSWDIETPNPERIVSVDFGQDEGSIYFLNPGDLRDRKR